MRASLAVLGCLVGFGVVTADWLDELDLSPYRSDFDSLGISGTDLAHLDEDDLSSISGKMRKYERRRFLRAVETSKSSDGPAPIASPAGRALQQVSGSGQRVDRETVLKEALLSGNGTGIAYDKTVPPAGRAGIGNQVEVGLNLYHVFGLDLSRASMQLQVWMRLRWVDERLAWNPADYGGMEQLTFIAAPVAIEEAQIWTPEVELYEGEHSTYDMPRKEVIVFSDGTCFWSRPGTLTSLCTLPGLANFPYDEVECPLRFGGWTLGGSYQNVTTFAEGAIDATQLNHPTYQEYKVSDVAVVQGSSQFSCCPDVHGWPYVEFSVKLQRAAKTYNIKIVGMNVVLTYLSFMVFFLDPKTGERIQTSVTLLLTIVAADSLVTGVIPSCRPALWIEVFFLICWGFVVLSILGNIVTMVLYYKSPPEVLASGMPRFAQFLERVKMRRMRLRQRRRGSVGMSLFDESTNYARGSAAVETAPASPPRSIMKTTSNQSQGMPDMMVRRRSGESHGSLRAIYARRESIKRQGTSNPMFEPNATGRRISAFRRCSDALAAVPQGAKGLVPINLVPSDLLPKLRRLTRTGAAEPAAADAAVGDGGGEGVSAADKAGDGESGPGTNSRRASLAPSLPSMAEGSERTSFGSEVEPRASEKSSRRSSHSKKVRVQMVAEGQDVEAAAAANDDGASDAEPSTFNTATSEASSFQRRSLRVVALTSRLQRTLRKMSIHNTRRMNRSVLASVLPFGSEEGAGAFVGAEDLAGAITATELDPVQASLVRKAFRLLDSMSASVGVLGPAQIEYFAHHMGKLPHELAEQHDENSDGVWSIEEFSTLCLSLIRIHGDDKFRVLVEGLLESYAHKIKVHGVYWKGWALFWDYLCMTILILGYTIALIVLYCAIEGHLGNPTISHVVTAWGTDSGS